MLVLLSYALQSPAAKQQAELARYNQLGDAALLAKGKELAKNGKDKLALNCFELLQSRGDRVAPALRAESEHEAGLLFYATNNYSKAMENFMNSMDICEKLKLDSLLALVYKDIGNIYSMYGDFDQSVPLYKKTLAMARARGEPISPRRPSSNTSNGISNSAATRRTATATATTYCWPEE